MTTLAIDIRPAEVPDACTLSAIHEASWREAYAGILPHRALNAFIMRRGTAWWVRTIRHASVLVLEVGDEVVGYTTFGRNRTGALTQGGEVYELYLRPEYQGIGLGRRLFRAALDRLDTLGATGTVVWAIEENERAVGFYHAMGGRDIAEGTERFETRVLNKVAFAFD